METRVGPRIFRRCHRKGVRIPVRDRPPMVLCPPGEPETMTGRGCIEPQPVWPFCSSPSGFSGPWRSMVRMERIGSEIGRGKSSASPSMSRVHRSRSIRSRLERWKKKRRGMTRRRAALGAGMRIRECEVPVTRSPGLWGKGFPSSMSHSPGTTARWWRPSA